MIDYNKADISETELVSIFGSEVFNRLLRDHSTYTEAKLESHGDFRGREDDYHIIWATNDYSHRGEGYGARDQISIGSVTVDSDRVIVPRSVKSRCVQRQRTQDKAEVFTPSWVCNMQNNLVDSAWFGREDVFNIAVGEHGWRSSSSRIEFPLGKTWLDYVSDTRLEITCGEAPYIVSRYDATTGEVIALSERIGMLDRKLRVVGENTSSESEWLPAAKKALQSVYGYEWQGDNLLLARESLFVSMLEYYSAKFGAGKCPAESELKMWAYIIGWNFWQMDGLKMVVPMSCHDLVMRGLCGDDEVYPCAGCKNNSVAGHNGTYCYIRQWPSAGKPGNGRRLRFVELLNQGKK